MKILMIGWYKPQIGGGSNVVQGLAEQLSATHDISIINMEEEGRPKGLGHWWDGPKEVFQEKMYFPSRFTNIQTLMQTTKRSFLKKRDIDIYHSHGPFFSGIGLVDKSKPLIVHVHGYASLEPITSGRIKENSIHFKFIRQMEKRSMERADAIITVSSMLKKWIIDELEVEPEKIFPIPNGVDFNNFRNYHLSLAEKKQIRAQYNLPNHSKVLLFTKHFTPRYGIQYLISALAQIRKKDQDVYLVATNEDPYIEIAKNIARTQGVESNCIFTGRLSSLDLIRLYNIADLFIHPSISDQETFGISLIEAMACELPVIATAVGGPKEILDQGLKSMGDRVGILVPPKDAKALAEAIDNFLNNPEKAEDMEMRARDFSIMEYSWDKIVHNIENVYMYALKSADIRH